MTDWAMDIPDEWRQLPMAERQLWRLAKEWRDEAIRHNTEANLYLESAKKHQDEAQSFLNDAWALQQAAIALAVKRQADEQARLAVEGKPD